MTRKRLTCCSLATLTLIGLAAGAGDLEPSGPPGPTMKTLADVEPRTPIYATDLPLTIASPGSYYLAENIVTAGGGITIDSDDVTIDLMGFALRGGNSDGIGAAPGTWNLTVRNGTVSGWSGSGVKLDSSTNVLVTGVRVDGNTTTGIWVGLNSVVANCVARGNAVGISAKAGSVIRDSTARQNGAQGIVAQSGSTVSGCSSMENSGPGIVAYAGSTVTGCSATKNGNIGIQAADDGVLIVRCSAALNTGDGIRVAGDAVVTGNSCSGNGLTGSGAGVHASGSNNRIEHNNVTGNDVGLDVDSAGNLIVRNSASDNGDNWGQIAAGNLTGTIVTSAAAMNGAVNGLVNIEY